MCIALSRNGNQLTKEAFITNLQTEEWVNLTLLLL